MKSLETIAEVYYRDTVSPVKCYLLGSDLELYQYNNLNHYLKPFSQTLKYKHVFTDEEKIKILDGSAVEYKDGDVCYGVNYRKIK